ncbi:peptide/nickel transport system ATP-binding protein [Rhizobium aethiopicum]|uniref:Peptide/nickel transport system ATP-binding protein n=1 Tax=Rhizobium aethiopicum TaxID=1138170 RepID=A0A7W6QBD9_9HYPH|nr:ABC transporter ATP-binding protein [Rhizobium aethiopicum]MBB4194423.1 peptide/nickel transport system ATP-binding protein [Rhizobium aethiopicum]MBB4582182.1 peptide/nickel transport system ATP-binding protein [Rhizobium aethiopicum]
MSDAILALDKVSKTFGHGTSAVHAARSISFSLHAGRALALVGESGSGKTTCARMAMREYQPTSGQILYKGRPVEAAKSDEIAHYRRSVQMIFQDPFASLNPAHTIAHHLRRPLKLHRPEIKGAAVDVTVRELLQRVRLDPDLVAPRYPHELSGGQRQRVNIARALAVRPAVIVADEPTSMLDVSVRLGVLNLLNEMKQEMNLGLLYITHDIATARYVAEDIAVMYAGQIVEWGSTAAVIDNPVHPYIRLLLSAVPDPDVRFDDPKARLMPDKVDDIRRRSAAPQDEIVEVEPDHFARMI